MACTFSLSHVSSVSSSVYLFIYVTLCSIQDNSLASTTLSLTMTTLNNAAAHGCIMTPDLASSKTINKDDF